MQIDYQFRMRRVNFRYCYGCHKTLLYITAIFALLIILFVLLPADLYPSNEEKLSRKLAEVWEDVNYLKHLDKEKQKAFVEFQRFYKNLKLRTIRPGQFNGSRNNSDPTNLYNLYNSAKNYSSLALLNVSSSLVASPSETDLSLPSIYDFMPNLLNQPESLAPALKISSPSRDFDTDSVWLTIGIPTIQRDKISYLATTLRSLIDNLDVEQKTRLRNRILIVVFIGDFGATQFATEQARDLSVEFDYQIRQGTLEIIVPSRDYYPLDLDRIPSTFGDSAERMRWRTKQNLDYAYLMMYCQNKGIYYMQLEDDIITKPGYVDAIRTFISKQNDNWYLLEFSSLGFIGKLFRSRDLPSIIAFIFMFHRNKPVDWLLDHMFIVRYCHPEKSNKECQTMINQHRIRYRPSLFQHVGVKSSLPGKVQKLKEKDFGKHPLHKPHTDNPSAHVSTTLKIYQKYSLEAAYLGDNFFWGLLPQSGDVIKFELTPPVRLESFTLRSGNAEHPDDMFYNASVEVKFSSTPDLPKNYVISIDYPLSEDGYSIITWFSSTGVAQAQLNSTWPIEVFRVVVHSESSNWVILSEIHLKVWNG